MHSLPLSSPSSAASSPAGATLPAIRTEYAGSTPYGSAAEVHDDDFGLTPEELIADVKRDVLWGRVLVGLLLLAGAAVLTLPFASAFGWF